MSTPDPRALQETVLRTLAGLIGQPHASIGRLHIHLHVQDKETALAMAQALPLRWEELLPQLAEDDYVLRAIHAGQVYVRINVPRGEAGTDGEERTVTVREFTPAPEFRALLAPEGGESA